jgi:CRISPR-associated protein Cas2
MAPDDKRVAEVLEKLKQRFAEAEGAKTAPTQRKADAPTRSRAPAPRGTDDEKVAPAQRSRRHWVVVSYDIPNDRRRTKVMKTLEGFGHRVQYSVFECELRPADLEKLKTRLKTLLEKTEDDIRFYDLCDNCQGKVTMLGQAKMYRAASSVIV